ncbi:tetratricopeptide repeat protein [Candidatus Absconditicoccus praedator]|uniref:tetratricopeptide repeat protein n=1 Tax=Candidatus Absconditicoccus praedator TaxID=2735562 RepID=UPI001E3805F2|nr:tetratricopeptide repeat protein [Candidatus Absconditicoccus praedator]UFX83352.1 tetratricopeptide repeat protein [Candidatus Absconditicoccus praedator]
MIIIFNKNDILLDLLIDGNPRDITDEYLKNILEELYKYGPIVPHIEIKGEEVRIELDIPSIEEYENKLQEATEFATRGSYHKARVLIDDLLEKYPTVSDFYRIKGQIFYETGKLDQAEKNIIEGLKLEPDNKWCLVVLGNIYQNKGKIEFAKNLYLKAIQKDPNDIYALTNYGAVNLQEGDYEEAEASLDQSYKNDPDYNITNYNLAVLYNYKDQFYKSFYHGIKAIEQSQNDENMKNSIMKVVFDSAKKYSYYYSVQELYDKYKQELEQRSQKSIQVNEDKNLQVGAIIKIAEYHGNNEHKIFYNPQNQYYKHSIMHELTHLKLIEDARDQKNNKIFAQTKENQAKFIKDLIGESMDFSKSAYTKDQIDYFSQNINLQLYNQPIDLIIEEYLFENYEDIRPIQFLNIVNMVKQGVEISNNKDIEKSTPKVVYEANVIMNIVQAYFLEDLFSVSFINEFKKNKLIRKAWNIYQDYKSKKDSLEPGDEYELINYRAEELGLSGYFSLIDEEEFSSNDFEVTDKKDEEPIEYENVDNFKSDYFDIIKDYKDKGKIDESEINMAIVMYCVGAIQYLENLDFEKIKEIAFEIGMKGAGGISYGDDTQYELKSIPGKKFTGYQLLAYMYVSWKIIEPTMDVGLDYSQEYELAKKILGKA